MSDNITGVTEIAAVSLADIAKQAQLYLQQESIMLGKIKNYDFMVTKGTKSIDIPRAGGFTVQDKGSEERVSAQSITWNADTLNLNKHKVVQFLIEDIASAQSIVELESEFILRAAADLARDIDKNSITELELASSSSPDHQLNFATSDTVTKAEVLNLRKLLLKQFIKPQECYLGINPTIEASMLAIDDFTRADAYGSAVIPNGVIGKIYGLDVFVHEDVSGMVGFHPTAAASAFHWMTRVKTDGDLDYLSERYSLDYLGGFKVLDEGVRCVNYTNA